MPGTRHHGGVAIFKKRRRHVGEFVAPQTAPLAPLDDVIEDALRIAFHGVKMTVKNRLILDALREHKPFDHEELEEVARAEYQSLAASSREAAVRAQQQLDRDAGAYSGRIYPGGKPVEIEPDHRRKPLALRAVADAYETRALEPASLNKLIDEAKAAAWDEIGVALASRLSKSRPDEDPEYLAFRDERLARFIAEDLAALGDRAQEV